MKRTLLGLTSLGALVLGTFLLQQPDVDAADDALAADRKSVV